MENLRIEKFSQINLADPFFNSLKENYKEFSEWFHKKAENEALVLYNLVGGIEGFLYFKYENGVNDDTDPLLPNTHHMKVGTFKFNPLQTRRGDRYLKKIFDYAISKKPDIDDIYVTIFGEKHGYLVDLFKRYGFEEYGTKTTPNGVENVLLRNLHKITGDVDKDYPFVNTKNNNKYLLSIYPNFHTKLFPDSKLFTESPDIVQDISYSNSIHKIFICSMDAVLRFKRGDVIVIYRTKDGHSAEYTSVATSLCVVESIKHIDEFAHEQAFIDYCIKFSVFTERELRTIYKERRYCFILNFTYNVAFPKRPIRKMLADEAGLSRTDYWGVMPLSDKQFDKIIELSGLDRKFLR
ncbi:hypothetical protein [Shewanella sp. GD03713]|uniref:hypothetical protein n=1 Tax=Shewanella sp. GD03713 TaxID=2975372 RepID=UPI0024468298|nr:hypothetical protein [Shewanella sp. GD03713]MDH1472137.1 hypothetical protein [Shewanella sp. GD03713]